MTVRVISAMLFLMIQTHGFECNICRKDLKITSKKLTEEILLSLQHTLETGWMLILLVINRLMWCVNAIMLCVNAILVIDVGKCKSCNKRCKQTDVVFECNYVVFECNSCD